MDRKVKYDWEYYCNTNMIKIEYDKDVEFFIKQFKNNMPLSNGWVLNPFDFHFFQLRVLEHNSKIDEQWNNKFKNVINE